MIQGNVLIPTKDERPLMTEQDAIALHRTFPLRSVPTDKSVCIVGCAPSSRSLSEEIHAEMPATELWSLNEAFFFLRCPVDRWYNVHPWKETSKYMGWLKSLSVPTHLISARPELPSSIRHPVETVYKPYRKILTSSIAHMVAAAVQEGYNPIYVIGVDMDKGSEYATQLGGMLYWLGVCDAKGIELILPQGCPLDQAPVYGYEGVDVLHRTHVVQYFAEVKHLYGEARVDARGLEQYAQALHDNGITGEPMEKARAAAHESLMKLNASGGAAQAIEHLLARFGPAAEADSEKLDDGYHDIHG